MLLGKLAQSLANSMCCVLWHIHYSCVDSGSLAGKSVKLWQNGVYKEALLLHLLRWNTTLSCYIWSMLRS